MIAIQIIPDPSFFERHTALACVGLGAATIFILAAIALCLAWIDGSGGPGEGGVMIVSIALAVISAAALFGVHHSSAQRDDRTRQAVADYITRTYDVRIETSVDHMPVHVGDDHTLLVHLPSGSRSCVAQVTDQETVRVLCNNQELPVATRP